MQFCIFILLNRFCGSSDRFYIFNISNTLIKKNKRIRFDYVKSLKRNERFKTYKQTLLLINKIVRD